MSYPSGGFPPPLARFAAFVGLSLTVVALVLFGGLQSAMPRDFSNAYGPFHPTVENFQETMTGRRWPGLEVDTFRLAFLALLLLAWIGYAVLAAGLAHGADLTGCALYATATVLTLGLALFCPISLSSDPYHYVGEGRILALYGQNPYSKSLDTLDAIPDPTLDDLRHRPIPSVYGPVWLLVAALAERLTGALPLWFQVTAFKVIAAGSLLGIAFAGRAVAEHYRPGTGRATFPLIAFNPLFLIEGPATGHNDLFMMFLFLFGAWCSIRGLWGTASLLLGLAAGVKYLPAAAVPWLILERLRGRSWRACWRQALGMAAVAVAPLVLAYLPFARGSSLGDSLTAHFARESTEEVKARIVWFTDRGVPEALAPALPAVLRLTPVAVVYAALVVWLTGWPGAMRSPPLRSGEGAGGGLPGTDRGSHDSGNWLSAWSILALCVFLFALGIWYPWYLTWAWTVALTRWDRPAVYVSLTCFTLAVLVTLRYSYAG